MKPRSHFLVKLLALSFGLVACATGAPKPATSPQNKASAQDVLMEREAAANRLLEQRRLTPGPLGLITNARIMTAAGTSLKSGYIVVSRGKIVAMAEGPPGDLPAEPSWVIDVAKLSDAGGQAVVTPGLIDTHSHLGVYPSPGAKAHSDGNEATAPNTAGVWAEHGFWPQDPGIQTAVAGGVTTIQVLPGSANLIGGRGVTLHLIGHRGSRAMRFPGAPIGVKMACGENPKRVYGTYRKRAPGTRMGNVRGHRAAFAKAKAFVAKLEKQGHDAPRDLQMETLAGVLMGTFLPQVHCYRADDIIAFMQVADEFGFKVRSFHHGLEAYKVRDLLKKHDVAVSTWTDWWGYKLEMYDGIPYNIALLHQAGVRAVLHSDSAQDIQRLNQEAGKAQRYAREAGITVTDDEALRWITANPAWALGIEKQVGTLELGKKADLVIWSGHPFSVYSKALVTIIDGHLVHVDAHKGKPWSDFLLGQDIDTEGPR